MHEPHDSETESRILAAARDVFVRSGTAGARMQEIADEAGVNKALLHYYFRSKERLALAVFRRALGQVLPRIHTIVSSPASLEEKVRAIIDAEFEFLAEHPYMPGYVISELHHHPEYVLQIFREIGPPPLATLRAQLDELAEAGTIRPIAAEQFLANLMSLILFPLAARPLLGAMLGVHGDGFSAFLAARREHLADFFLRGLRP